MRDHSKKQNTRKQKTMFKRSNGNRRSSSSSSFSSGYSTDLLVCFPPRSHLSLTTKPIFSPSRSSDSSINRRPHHRPQLSKLSSRKNDEITEPTSPKVTCAGQIKVRSSKGKNWQSVMEEIERIHDNNKSQRKLFGFKKDVLSFLTCLRNIRFDFRCFGDFRHDDVISDDDDEVEEEEENSKTVFSKWFMVLQEDDEKNKNDEKSDLEPAVPPSNALLLMRCRSAPAKSWLEERMKVETEEENREREMSIKKKKDLRSLMEEEKMELVLMRYDTEFYRLSSDIAKETWVVGGIQDSLSRSRSTKN